MLIVLVLFVLLLLLPVGAAVGYKDGEIQVFAQVWRMTACVYPRPPREKKPRKKKEKKQKKSNEPAVVKDEVLDAIEVAVRSIKKLHFRLHRLKLHFIAASPDPYDTAMLYGYASAGVQALGLPNLKQSDVQLAVDFEREKLYLDTYVAVTIRIYYILKLLCCLMGGMVPILWRRHKRLNPKKNSGAVKGTVT